MNIKELLSELLQFSKEREWFEFKENCFEPVNEDMSSIFLATHLSERTGKGNPLIFSNFGRKAFKINEDSIIVTIPYNWIRSFKDLVDKSVDKLADKLSKTELKILYAIKENPKMSQIGIAKITNTGKTTVQNTIVKLKHLSLIKRIGSNKTGYWQIIDNNDHKFN